MLRWCRLFEGRAVPKELRKQDDLKERKMISLPKLNLPLSVVKMELLLLVEHPWEVQASKTKMYSVNGRRSLTMVLPGCVDEISITLLSISPLRSTLKTL